jgi:hypothetical protein
VESEHASISDLGQRYSSSDFAHLCAESFARADDILSAILLIDALPRNTRRAYLSSLRLWCLWYRLRFGAALPLPVPISVVQQFLLDFTVHRLDESSEADPLRGALPNALDELLVRANAKRDLGPMSLSVVQLRMAALRVAHRYHDLPSPTRTHEIQQQLKHLCDEHLQMRDGRARSLLPRETNPVHVADVCRAMDACEHTLVGMRDRALIGFVFCAGRQPLPTVAGTTVESLEIAIESSGQVSLLFGNLQVNAIHSPPGDTDLEALLEETAYCVNVWLNAAGISAGLVWRGIEKHALSTGLSAGTICRIVRRRFSRAGLAGINPRSLRAGFMMATAEQRISGLTVRALCGTRSGSKFGRYVPAGSAMQRFLADRRRSKRPP